MKLFKKLAIYAAAGFILTSALTGCALFNSADEDEEVYDETDDDEYYESQKDISDNPCSDETWAQLYQSRDTLTDLYDETLDALDNNSIEATDEINNDLKKAADIINYFADYKQKDISEDMAASILSEMNGLITTFESVLK